MASLRTLTAAVLDALLPGDCTGCGQPGPLLCEACRRPLRCPPRQAWPQPSPPGLPVPFASARYEGPVRAALLAYKERGALALADPLATALAAAVTGVIGATAAAGRGVVLVPMPSSRDRRRDRGDDVVARLARHAAARLRRSGTVTGVVPALCLVRRVADSSGLSAPDRRANLAGAIRMRPGADRRLNGAAVVLVDDLITTGATLSEAADSLRQSGIRPVGAAVVAATVRRAGALRT